MTGSLSSLGSGIWRRVTRKKHVDVNDVRTELRRCISTKRLTLIGLGRTVGVGIYILIGVATKDYAGPAVILSFLIAFVVTLLNALCFAEYASKNPKTGAQYTYMYEAVGEAIAFIVGWTTIVCNLTALALEARGWSGYLDSLFNHAIQNYTMTHIAHWSNGPPFSEYPDFPAVFIVLVIMVVSSIGVNFSATVNSVLTIVSGSVLVFITIAGLFYADFHNWFDVEGGFFPYGLKGVLKGSSACPWASCFYAYLGFDVIGLSAEETKNPKKAVPRAIICELLLATLLYLGVSISFTLMIPYPLISTNAPFPSAFAYHSVTWAKYIVVIGPLFALSNLCTLEMYSTTRVAYSMASDGLLFSVFSKINKRSNVPVMSIMIFGPFVIAIVLAVDLKNVVSFMVIYTLLQYSFFACYLLILRYDPSWSPKSIKINENNTNETAHCNVESDVDVELNVLADGTMSYNRKECNNRPDIIQSATENLTCLEPTHNKRKANATRSGVIGTLKMFSEVMTVTKCATCIYISSFLLAIILIHGSEDLLRANPLSMYSALTLSVIIIVSTLCVYYKDQHGDTQGYLIPLMPFSPVLCILCDMLLLVSVAEVGSVIAASLLAAIGAVIYMVIVITDVVKHGTPSTSRDLTSQEQVRLLTDADSDDTDFEQETTH